MKWTFPACITGFGPVFLFVLAITVNDAMAGDPQVKSHELISQSNFAGDIGENDGFGYAMAFLGDLDNDGIGDIAVGAPRHDEGDIAENQGAVWIIFLNADGTVKAQQEISDSQGGFNGGLGFGDGFGKSVANIGDLDQDGVVDLAVGVSEFPNNIWIVFLNDDGTVKDEKVLGAVLDIAQGDLFGVAVDGIGDLNNDGVMDIAVGAPQDDDGGDNRGAVWVLFLTPDGFISGTQKISDTQGNFFGTLSDFDKFGAAVVELGDLNNDDVTDIVVGAWGDSGGGFNRGAVWILFMNADGTVSSHQKINEVEGNFTGALDDSDWFGWGLAAPGDIDCDGILDLAVGAPSDDDGGSAHGAVWLLLLTEAGTVKLHSKISDTEGNFTGNLGFVDNFGQGLAGIEDHDGNFTNDIVVGAPNFDDGGPGTGSTWVLFLESFACAAVPVLLQAYGSEWTDDHVRISCTLGDISGAVNFEVARRRGARVSEFRSVDVIVERMGNEFTLHDYDVAWGESYTYRVGIFEGGEIVTSFDTQVSAARPALRLEQNRPNPFNPSTRIDFVVDEASHVDVSIYDTSGRLVTTLVSRTLGAGPHSALWDGRDGQGNAVASGIYFYRLTAGSRILTRKAVLLK